MNFLLPLALILSVCSFVQLLVYQDFRDKDYPGKCVYKGVILSKGKRAKITGACEVLNCKKHGFGYLETCAVKIHPDPSCRYGELLNPDAKFDRCCKRGVICE